MQNTPNYNLNKPEYTDFADVVKLNENMDILDTKLKEVSDIASDTNLRAEFDQHVANMAQHNQYMNGTQKVQLVFGVNKTLNCLTIEEVNI